LADELKVALTGFFPRSRAFSKLQARYQKNKISEELYREKAFDILVRTLKKLSVLGLDVGSDLMLLDEDLFYPFIEDLENVERGWLVRFYDNNYFVRNVVAKGEIRLRRYATNASRRLEVYAHLKSALDFSEWVVAVPGPLTLARFTVASTEHYKSSEEIVRDYLKALREIYNFYSSSGVALEIHEPELCALAGDYESSLWRTYADALSNVGEAQLVSYFCDLSAGVLRLLPKRLTIGVDLVEGTLSEEKVGLLREFKAVRLGIVNSRNTKMENIEELLRTVSRLINAGVNVQYLSFNTMTEFLPESVAFRKIKLLRRVKEALS